MSNLTEAKTAVKKTSKSSVPKKTAVKKTAVIKKTAAVVRAAVGVEKISSVSGRYVFATGRRKTAVANVRLFDEPGDFSINRKSLQQYFNSPAAQDIVLQAFKLTGLGQGFRCEIFVNGGGTFSQAEAVRHALSRALLLRDETLRLVLKKNGLLTRDSRKKERKKPGLKRARRAPQWAKR